MNAVIPDRCPNDLWLLSFRVAAGGMEYYCSRCGWVFDKSALPPHWKAGGNTTEGITPGTMVNQFHRLDDTAGCSFPGCGRLRKSRGYCEAHYQQLMRGKPLTPIKAKRGGL